MKRKTMMKKTARKVSSSTPAQPVIPCHDHGNILVFQTPTLAIYGGGITRGARLIHGGLTVNMTIASKFGFEPPIKARGWEPTRAMNYNTGLALRIPIHDGNAPTMGLGFWADLLADIADLAKTQTPPFPVLITCLGGHGRTGTTLAMFAHILLGEPEPITYIRANYCPMAIETLAQEEYIADLTGCVQGIDASPWVGNWPAWDNEAWQGKVYGGVKNEYSK